MIRHHPQHVQRIHFSLDGWQFRQILKLFQNGKHAKHLGFRVGQPIPKNSTGGTMLELIITSEEKIPVTIKPVTSTGKPAQVQAGSVSWEVTAGDATLEIAQDGMSAKLVSGEPDVTSSITVSADADLGEGVETISDTISLVVVHPKAKALGLEAGQAEPK